MMPSVLSSASSSSVRKNMLSIKSISIACVVLIVLTCCTSCSLASPVNKKNISTCSSSTPCGWLVYHADTKSPDYYVRSICSCASGEMCVRDKDDISISSYIYRCRNSTEAKDLDVLKEDIDSESTAFNSLISEVTGVLSSGDTNGE